MVFETIPPKRSSRSSLPTDCPVRFIGMVHEPGDFAEGPGFLCMMAHFGRAHSGMPAGVRGLVTGAIPPEPRLCRQCREQAENARKMRQLGTITTGITHDFNNLLTAIVGQANLAMMGLPDGHPARTSLKMIEKAAQHGGELTDALLQAAGGRAMERAPLNLTRLLTDSLAMVRAIVGERVEVWASIESEPEVWVVGSALQLRRVIFNLVDNARKAMPTGGRLTVGLRRRPAGLFATGDLDGPEVVEMSFADNGVGLSAELRSALSRTTRHDAPGSGRNGLGLHLVREIVLDHGGRLSAMSPAGSGARFVVALPVCSPAVEQMAGASADGRLGHRANLLLVAADDHARSIMAFALRSSGFEVVEVAGLAAARRAVEEANRPFSAMIVDADDISAGDDGLDRASDSLPCRVVTLTSDRRAKAAKDARVRVLHKPVRLDSLAITAAQVISESPEQEEAA